MKISASSSRFCSQLVAVAFSLVVFSCAAGAAEAPRRSRIYVYDLRTHSSKLVFTADGIWEAPNWSPDGKYIVFESAATRPRSVLRGFFDRVWNWFMKPLREGPPTTLWKIEVSAEMRRQLCLPGSSCS